MSLLEVFSGQAIQLGASMVSYGADYCQKRGDCFFIGDMILSDNTIERAQTFIDNVKIMTISRLEPLRPRGLCAKHGKEPCSKGGKYE